MRLTGKDETKADASGTEGFMNEKFKISDRINVPINADDSINCPECETIIKDYKEAKIFILFGSVTRPKCGHIIFK